MIFSLKLGYCLANKMNYFNIQKIKIFNIKINYLQQNQKPNVKEEEFFYLEKKSKFKAVNK